MYKVWVRETKGTSYATNSLEFETVKEAKTYGDNLFMRWLALESWAVLPAKPEFVGYLSESVVERNKVE